ncbi:LGFP repeat-containing protein [Gordonia sp. VNK21]|uniref:LGFP repeat-containing protein n=1 Tax=Gordonia sp. VNK21 TaxID=3382483 RepID=UPI0038D35CBA
MHLARRSAAVFTALLLMLGVAAAPGPARADVLGDARTAITGYLAQDDHEQLLGDPSGGVRRVAGGAVQSFEHGRVYFSRSTGAHAVLGAIADRYRAAGGPGALGFPVTDEQDAGPGKVSEFDLPGGAAIYWSRDTGAHAIRGGVLRAWRASGGVDGPFGFPTSDTASTGREDASEFAGPQGTRISWSSTLGLETTPAELMTTIPAMAQAAAENPGTGAAAAPAEDEGTSVTDWLRDWWLWLLVAVVVLVLLIWLLWWLLTRRRRSRTAAAAAPAPAPAAAPKQVKPAKTKPAKSKPAKDKQKPAKTKKPGTSKASEAARLAGPAGTKEKDRTTADQSEGSTIDSTTQTTQTAPAEAAPPKEVLTPIPVDLPDEPEGMRLVFDGDEPVDSPTLVVNFESGDTGLQVAYENNAVGDAEHSGDDVTLGLLSGDDRPAEAASEGGDSEGGDSDGENAASENAKGGDPEGDE